jgi:hypothetical protein
MLKKIYGEDHIEYATIKSNLSNVQFKLQEFNEAKNGYSKALDIL